MNTPIFNKLMEYHSHNPVCFHMPGHLLGKGLYEGFIRNMPRLDVTELMGTDNLHYPEGIIKEAEELAAKAFGAQKTFFLVNGSTAGIHAMLLSVLNKGEKLIVSRDCHKSVVNSMLLGGIEPVYVMPEIHQELGLSLGPSLISISGALNRNPDAKGVFLTRPSYYGICCDLKAISDVVHENGKVLMVDEAHGAHFSFSDLLPKTAMELGADICVQSAHKTLPALTQCSYLHVGSSRVDIDRVYYNLRILQTSSPSYIFMSSLDIAREIMQKNGEKQYGDLMGSIDGLAEELRHIDGFAMVSGDNNKLELDRTRLVIDAGKSGISGYEADRMLRSQYNIQVEMSDLRYIVCIATPYHSRQEIILLGDSLKQISKKCKKQFMNQYKYNAAGIHRKGCTYDKLHAYRKRMLPVEKANGRIAADMIIPYPPGIPLICPGEIFTGEDIFMIMDILDQGGVINGLNNGEVMVVEDRQK